MMIEGEKVILRPISAEDTESILRWRNKEAVRSNFIYRETLTREEHEKWLEEKVRKGTVCQFIIEAKETGAGVGSVYLRDLDYGNRKCEFGIFIGEDSFRGKGLGTESARLATGFAFEQLNMNKVYLRVLAENERAYRSYLRAGFRKDGTAREDVLIDGRFHDVIFMSIIRREV